MSVRGGAGPGAQTFEAMLLAAQAGAAWACTAIWVEYAPTVAAFLKAQGSREPDDLTSEVFLAVFDRLPGFSGGEQEFRSFVFSIAYRRLVDELRSRSRRGDEASALSLLDGLPEDQRNVMVLRIIADLTIDQIAAVLGKRPGAVKALQRRALEGLRKKVSPARTLRGPSDDSGGVR